MGRFRMECWAVDDGCLDIGVCGWVFVVEGLEGWLRGRKNRVEGREG